MYNLRCNFSFFFIFSSILLFAQNKLADEGSLYLQQHANNPIHWNPWGEEALERAKIEQKLIVVSVGYSSCHWCHVMEEETFQDNDVAIQMNSNFISIKVDREERPDIDAHFMKALKTISGNVGWPMNIIALPDGSPIWAGTYVDKTQWISILKQLQSFYKTRPSDLKDHAKKIEQGISKTLLTTVFIEQSDFSNENIANIVSEISQRSDMEYGGFGKGEKFMSPIVLKSLLRYAVQFDLLELKDFLKKSLLNISFGGVNDQIGGGFHRYSIDRKWKIPHFEKMLYDNVQMLSLYASFYQVFKDDFYKEEAYKILRFLNSEMKDTSLLFYSSIAADSQDLNGFINEGDFYTWSLKDLNEALGNNFGWFSDYYNISNDEILESNRFILFRQTNDSVFADKYNWSEDYFKKQKIIVKDKLYGLRQNKPSPVVDKKIIFSWNAVAIRGLIDSYKSFGDSVFLEQANQILNVLISESFYKKKRIKHTTNTSESLLLLEDYVFLIDALIGYYEVTADENKLSLAKELTDFTLNTFTSEDGIYLKFSKDENQSITGSMVQLEDNLLPSANSKMAENLFKLNHFFGLSEYKIRAEKMTSLIQPMLFQKPLKYANWLQSTCNFTFPFYEIAITGPLAIDKMNLLLPFYLPNSVISTSASKSGLYLLKDRHDPIDSYYFVCENNFCKIPVQSIDELFTLIDTKVEDLIYNPNFFKEQ